MMKPGRLSRSGLLVLVAVTVQTGIARADSWAAPRDATYLSENGQYEFLVQINDTKKRRGGSTGVLRRREGDQWVPVWTQLLQNHVCPVKAMVMDSGKYVVTFDEYHSVGQNPVVIYGDEGKLIAKLTLADLKLERHTNITRSISSYWWNASAIMVFGPSAINRVEPGRAVLANSLFIRLYWGEVIAIDLASGRVRDDAWWAQRAKSEAKALQQATKEHLDATWLRLARDYLRKENLEPDPTSKGIQGILLAGQLRLREALPILQEVASTDRFKGWAAHALYGGRSNLRDLAAAAIQAIQ